MTAVHDVVGVGFGPSNLALAIALAECGSPLTARFVERQPRFGWHRGMLLEDATMQVSFLKDLVTLRNPASDYSFLSYLHERERLVDFVNHKTLFPLRIEFHDYLEWAAGRLGHLVDYGEHVDDVRPVAEAGRVVAFDVVSERADGARRTRRARNVVAAAGLAPSLPAGVELSERVWHNRDLLHRADALVTEPAPRRFVVVGAGQSAAEAVDHLHRRFPDAEVCSVFTRFGYSPADDSPFANRIFDPDAVDTYFGADDTVKELLDGYHRNTNYSVVDTDLIGELYRRHYQEKVLGRQRLRVMNASRIASLDERDGGVDLDVEFLPTAERERMRADAVVFATGYRPIDVTSLLGSTGELVLRRPDGAPELSRDYRLSLTVPADAGVYVQGATEHTHGIASTLLSNVAVRSGEIVDSLLGRSGSAPARSRAAMVAAAS